MALSKREKMIAIGTGAAVALLGLQMAVIGPYVDRVGSITTETDDKQKQQNDVDDLFSRQRRLRTVWTDLTKGGLSADPSAAESQTVNALYNWAQSAGVEANSLQPDRVSTENQFQVTGFRFTGTGKTPAVATLLWDIETATIPVRLTDVQIAPRKEGTDELTVQLSISTLTLRQPDAKPKPPANVTAALDVEDRS